MIKLKSYLIFFIDIFWVFKEQILFFRELKKIQIKPYQLMWVNPQKIMMTKCKADPNCIERIKRKFLLNGDWDEQLVDPLKHQVVKASFDVSKGNSTWELTGEHSRMNELIKKFGKFDNYYSAEELHIRYKKLDKIVTSAKKIGTFVNQKTLKNFYFREYGGIEVAIGRNGDIIKVGDGQHRLGIALGLGLKVIPVSLILVHSNFIKNFKSKNLKI